MRTALAPTALSLSQASKLPASLAGRQDAGSGSRRRDPSCGCGVREEGREGRGSQAGGEEEETSGAGAREREGEGGEWRRRRSSRSLLLRLSSPSLVPSLLPSSRACLLACLPAPSHAPSPTLFPSSSSISSAVAAAAAAAKARRWHPPRSLHPSPLLPPSRQEGRKAHLDACSREPAAHHLPKTPRFPAAAAGAAAAVPAQVAPDPLSSDGDLFPGFSLSLALSFQSIFTPFVSRFSHPSDLRLPTPRQQECKGGDMSRGADP